MKLIVQCAAATVCLIGLFSIEAFAGSAKGRGSDVNPCRYSAKLLKRACKAELTDEFFVGAASCVNLKTRRERTRCTQDIREERSEALQDCSEVYDARVSACRELGRKRYDPDFSPANFVDPTLIGTTIEPNPYFPLVTGYQWVYQGGGEQITDAVTSRTKLINGVTCKVVTDEVLKDGVLIEYTDDWYAQDTSGNVWYCGEVSQEFEVFSGDNPQEAELVDIGGSWKAGIERAQPGIVMYRNPEVGKTYRLEVKFTDAEDMAEVLSTTGSETTPATSCNGTCIVTRDFTPLSPGVEETKYYAPGIGLILEKGHDGERTELVQFNAP